MRDWDNIYKVRGEILTEVDPKIKRIVPFLKKNKVRKVLDLGCGTGRHTIFLAQHGFIVTGVDISETALKITRSKLNKAKIKNVELIRRDMESILFPSDYFDVIICTGVLSHGKFEKIKNTVNEIFRVLRKGGIFIADPMSIKDSDCGKGKEIEPNTFIGLEEEEDTPHHYFTKKEILELLSKFKIIKLTHRTSKIYYKKRKNKTSQWQIIAIKK